MPQSTKPAKAGNRTPMSKLLLALLTLMVLCSTAGLPLFGQSSTPLSYSESTKIPDGIDEVQIVLTTQAQHAGARVFTSIDQGNASLTVTLEHPPNYPPQEGVYAEIRLYHKSVWVHTLYVCLRAGPNSGGGGSILIIMIDD